MKHIVMAKKFRYILAVVALADCTAAFAADRTADAAQTTQSQYTCPYHQDCSYGNGQGRGHHHHRGYCHQNDAQTVTQQ